MKYAVEAKIFNSGKIVAKVRPARTTGKRERRMRHKEKWALLALVYIIGWIVILLVLANKSTLAILGLGMVFFGVNTVMLIRGR